MFQKISTQLTKNNSKTKRKLFKRKNSHFFKQLKLHADAQRTAVLSSGVDYSYCTLGKNVTGVSKKLTHILKGGREKHVAFLCGNHYDWVKVQCGIWHSGNVSVPLSVKSTKDELEYYIVNSQSRIIIADDCFLEKVADIATRFSIPLLSSKGFEEYVDLEMPEISLDSKCQIIYTSGTTGKPKGAVWTHRNLQQNISSMNKTWHRKSDEHILQFLPLNHIHGIVNVINCCLYNGGVVEMMDFDVNTVWDRIISNTDFNTFMAVPTIYAMLANAYDKFDKETQKTATESLKKLRLMVSGSMALPAPLFDRWAAISGHRLLERYGMTEIGMALTNPYEQEDRVPGTVGYPFPGVKVRLASDDDHTDIGELQIKGDNVFKEYYGLPDATQESFTKDGWFKTGDIASVENGRYKILGRSSVDIIKSAGYKISALDIERELLGHPNIDEIAVLGIEDPTWGQIIGAIVVRKNSEEELTLDQLDKWCRSRISNYKIPRLLNLVQSIPKNAMGKINKKELVKLFEDQ